MEEETRGEVRRFASPEYIAQRNSETPTLRRIWSYDSLNEDDLFIDWLKKNSQYSRNNGEIRTTCFGDLIPENEHVFFDEENEYVLSFGPNEYRDETKKSGRGKIKEQKWFYSRQVQIEASRGSEMSSELLEKMEEFGYTPEN